MSITCSIYYLVSLIKVNLSGFHVHEITPLLRADIHCEGDHDYHLLFSVSHAPYRKTAVSPIGFGWQYLKTGLFEPVAFPAAVSAFLRCLEYLDSW